MPCESHAECVRALPGLFVLLRGRARPTIVDASRGARALWGEVGALEPRAALRLALESEAVADAAGRALDHEGSELWLEIDGVRYVAALSPMDRDDEVLLCALSPAPSRDTRGRFQLIVEESPDIIAMIDREYRHVYVNRAVQPATGLTPAEFEGKTHVDLGMPEALASYFQSVYRAVFESGREGTKDFDFPTPTGVRSYSSRVVPLVDPDGKVEVVLSYARDVTEQRHAEAERLEMERKLQETQRLESLGLLAGGIAHDFNNLLTIILGHVALLRGGRASDERGALAQIESAALRAAGLSAQMLAYAGREAAHKAAVDVGSMLRDTLSLLGSSFAKTARLELDVAPGLPSVHADPSQLAQVVMNLVLNGVEALPAGAGAVRVRASLVDEATIDWSDAVVRPPSSPGGSAGGSAEGARKLVEVVVEDDGVGMSETTRAKVFDPFFTTKFAGRGLGLAAALGIARAHGAGLRVASQLGRGSTFALYLTPDATRPREARAPGPAAAGAGARSTRVLVVEDEDLVRRVIVKMLECEGYSVRTAGSGREALEHIEQSGAIDLALIDVTMPGIDGLETLTRLRERAPGLPAVLMSGHGAADLEARLARHGARFLQKPFSQGALREALEAATREGAARDESRGDAR